ncbi:type II secretion system pilot lipoprotein GspS (plasmid) [Pantoea sp. BJ2]|uniref:Type II secretion system pilot lipoprotein GspS n=1 Tax=Pantoea sp. BJ2 TaxID=3141322 RepID=A0AAU7U3G0_9GAMM
MTFTLRFGCIIATLCILAGCETSKHPQPPQSIQEQQLAALISGSNWVRNNCNQKEIPEQSVLVQNALVSAKEKGWKVELISSQMMSSLIDERYQKLSEDRTPVSQKCATLSSALMPFLQNIK